MLFESNKPVILPNRVGRGRQLKGRLPILALMVLATIATWNPVGADDCNVNGIDDDCDISCGSIGGPCDIPGCGTAADCDSNGIPDLCDIDSGAWDLNHDGVLDRCVFSLVYERVTPCGNFFLAPRGVSDHLRQFDRNGNLLPSLSTVTVNNADGPISCDADGNIMVPEWGNDRVLVISPSGDLVRTISGGGLDGPTGSAVTPDGKIAVCSYLSDSVKFYSPLGVYESNFAHSNGTQDTNSVAFDRAGKMYVGCRNNGNPHVARFSRTLQFEQYIGQGQFIQGCFALAFDADENLYVTTSGSIKKFAHDGTFLSTITAPDLNPRGMVIDETGDIWVTNSSALEVFRFDSSGQYLETIPVSFGSNSPPGLSLYGIAFDVRPESDCNLNSMPDSCEIADGTEADCNSDGIPDSCQLVENDCNSNGVIDACDPDCDSDGTPDECEISSGEVDCDSNGIPDDCEITASSTRNYLSGMTARAFPSEHATNPPNLCTDNNVATFTWSTASNNFTKPSYLGLLFPSAVTLDGIRLWKDNDGGGGANSKDLVIQYTIDSMPVLGSGTWQNVSSLSNGYLGTELMVAVSVNSDGTIQGDTHDSVNDGHGWATLRFSRIQATGIRIGFSVPDNSANHYKVHEFLAFRADYLSDCNANGALDSCDLSTGSSSDCNANLIPDECESDSDCNNNGVQDICEPNGSADCDSDGITDLCELESGAADCDENQIPDECDAAAGNRALAFDDIDDRVWVPDSTSLNPGSFTVEAWIYLNAVQSRNTRLIRKLPGSIGMILAADQDNDQRIQLRVHTPGTVIVKDTQSHSAYVGQWHHVAGVYSADSASLYIDGVLKATTVHANGPLPANNGELYFGAGLPASDNSEFFGGKMDEIQLWNYPRTESQILADMNKSYVGTKPGLVGYWRLNEGSGQTAGDSSGMGNDGVVGASSISESSDPQWVESTEDTPGPSDCNGNGVPDACDVNSGASQDCNFNNIPDECEQDCNGNGFADECDIANGEPDCNADQIPDSCNIAQGMSSDINTDGIPDDCQSDIKVVPVVTVIDPSLTSESRSTEPTSLNAVTRGGLYYVELWASDIGDSNTGLTGVYTDVEFCGATSANFVDHGTVFTVFPEGTIGAGVVDEFGGSALPSGGGIAPEWVRIGWIQMSAGQESSACSIRLAPSSSGIAALNRGSIDWAFVDLGSVDLEIVPPAKTYDLDGSGFINVGDLSLFAGSWLNAVPPGQTAHDFDCDDTVGVGDLSWFATGWLKNANDPTILYPPCGATSLIQRGQSTPADVSVRIAVLTSPTSGDIRTSVPASVSGLATGQQYYVEVWVSDVGDINSGVTSAYFDLDFNAEAFSVLNINHNSVFTLFPSGSAGAGIIDELGGSVLSGGNAVEPLWARLATVRVFTNNAVPYTVFDVRPSATGVAAYGRGALPWDVVDLSSLGIGVPEVGDVNADGYANLQDIEPFSAVLLGLDSDPGHAFRSNINQDASVDGLDVAALTNLLLAQ